MKIWRHRGESGRQDRDGKTVGGERRGKRRERGTDHSMCLFKREGESCSVVVSVLFQQVCDRGLSVNALMRPKEVQYLYLVILDMQALLPYLKVK